MAENVVLIAGDWRAGADLDTVDLAEKLVKDVEELDQWPFLDSERVVVKLTNLLDAYDQAFEAAVI